MAKAKRKILGTDGFGPHELKKVHAACRQVWQRCHARKLVQKRCTGDDGYYYCQACKERTPKLTIDHIEAVGSLKDDGYIKRLFCPSVGLQGLCHPCHLIKTSDDKAKKLAQSAV